MPNRSAHTAEARSVNRDERTIDVVASTGALDSYNTRIDPNGWELEQFRKNPVITWAHDDRGYTASGGRPIAKGENIRVEDGKLKIRLKFPERAKFPFADEVFDLMSDGFLNAVSVGFDPVEWRDENTEKDGNVRVFTRQRLMELAVVTIPSNDEALVERQSQRLNANTAEVRTRLEKVERMAGEQKDGPEDAEKAPIDYKAYFDKKQPANRESTKVLERFFKKVLKEDPPAEEVKAWQRIAEAVEAMEELLTPTPEEKAEIKETVMEATVADPEPAAPPAAAVEPTPEAPVVTLETKEEEPTPPPTAPAQEAPEPARKACVQIPLTELPSLVQRLTDALVDAAVKASRQGVPFGELDGVIDAASMQFAGVLTTSRS